MILRNLRPEQKHFLREQGLNPKDFLSIDTRYDHYRFYCISKKIEFSVRR